MSKFRNIPEPPYATKQEDLNWFEQVKYNLEILMRQREGDDGALLRSDVKVLKVPDPNLARLKTGQEGVVILSASTLPAAGDVTVPTLADYEQLQKDVDTLRADVTVLRTYLNSLILQLRGREE
jgi:hypothetical protein